MHYSNNDNFEKVQEKCKWCSSTKVFIWSFCGTVTIVLWNILCTTQNTPATLRYNKWIENSKRSPQPSMSDYTLLTLKISINGHPLPPHSSWSIISPYKLHHRQPLHSRTRWSYTHRPSLTGHTTGHPPLPSPLSPSRIWTSHHWHPTPTPQSGNDISLDTTSPPTPPHGD